MKRLGEAWFSFGGVRSSDMGLRLVRMPERKNAARKGAAVGVPGRDGMLWIDGGGYAQVRIEVECESTDGFDETAVRAWLGGAQKKALVFSDRQDREYRARVTQGAGMGSARDGYDRKRIVIPFVCDPLVYARPEASAVVLTAAGTVENPGTAQSEPRIAVTAAGDYTLVVNGRMMEVKGGSIIIDSELRDCLSADGASLANSRVTMDEFPKLDPGANNVSWTGNVTKVEIARRVRYL